MFWRVYTLNEYCSSLFEMRMEKEANLFFCHYYVYINYC